MTRLKRHRHCVALQRPSERKKNPISELETVHSVVWKLYVELKKKTIILCVFAIHNKRHTPSFKLTEDYQIRSGFFFEVPLLSYVSIIREEISIKITIKQFSLKLYIIRIDANKDNMEKLIAHAILTQ